MKKFKFKRLAVNVLATTMILGLFGGAVNASCYIPPQDLPIAGNLPSDYESSGGLGYYLRSWYNVEPEIYGSSTLNHGSNDNTKIALGDINAIIVIRDGKYYLHLQAKYEISMDVWQLKSPGATSWEHTKKPVTSNSGQLGDLVIPIASAYGHSRNDTGGVFGYDFNYIGPDGTIKIKYKINNGAEVTNSELSVKVPVNYWANTQSYFGEIDHYYLLPASYGTVRGVQITEILGNDLNMYVTRDGSVLKTNILDGVGYVDREINGDNATYKIQLNADPYLSGYYDIKFSYQLPNENYLNTITKRVWLSSNYGTDEYIELTIPSNATALVVSGISTLSGDGTFSGYSDDIYRAVEDWRYNVDFNVICTDISDYINLDSELVYSVHTSGDYVFAFSYDVYDENSIKSTETLTCIFELDNNYGCFNPNTCEEFRFPANAAEIRLSRITSPDGVVKYPKQVLYQNASIVPEAPGEFSSIVTVTDNSIGGPYRVLQVNVDYAFPEVGYRTMLIEYEVNGVVRTFTRNYGSANNYGSYSFGQNGECGTNGATPFMVPKDATYVRLVSISDRDGTVHPYNQYLYCNHNYTNECDIDCDRCGECREVPPHLWDNDCDTECNVCGLTRTTTHQFSTPCDPTCDICGAANTDIRHTVHTQCDSTCIYCGATRENFVAEHYYSSDDDMICDYCGHDRTSEMPHNPEPQTVSRTNTGVIDFVERIYNVILNRTSDQAGADFWYDSIVEHGVSASTVAHNYVISPEFTSQNHTTEEYVTILYRTLLGREPDQEGLNYWVTSIENGTGTREDVFNGFANSPEWRGICASYGVNP